MGQFCVEFATLLKRSAWKVLLLTGFLMNWASSSIIRSPALSKLHKTELSTLKIPRAFPPPTQTLNLSRRRSSSYILRHNFANQMYRMSVAQIFGRICLDYIVSSTLYLIPVSRNLALWSNSNVPAWSRSALIDCVRKCDCLTGHTSHV